MTAFLFIHKSRRARRFVVFAVCALVLVVGAVSVAYAATRWSNGQAASIVQGQPNFITNTTGSTADKMNTPYGVAVDPATGKLFVADLNNSRVLRFSSANALISGSAAEAVLGQADFAGTFCNRSNVLGTPPADNTLCSPWAVWVDSGGRLWVADANNNRVLRFDNGATIASGSSANVVLGQSDFVSGGSAVAPNRMNGPYGLFVDSAGRLWVADRWNGRVLRFDNAASKGNGANADGVLGAPDFSTANYPGCSTTPVPAQNNMCGPAGVVGDGAGNLFVADLQYNRVLRFNNAAGKANGANADGVLGQPNFTSNAPGKPVPASSIRRGPADVGAPSAPASPAATQAGMNLPRGVMLDETGRLFVGDTGNNRILIFENAVTKANGANADNVLGQINFTNSSANMGGPVSANSLNAPRLLYFDTYCSTSRYGLWAVDTSNHRVLKYSLLFATTTALTASPNPSYSGQTVTFIATVTGSCGTPTGTVSFNIAGCTSVAMSGGRASCTTTSPGKGAYTVTANYSGDPNYLLSAASLSQTVGDPAPAEVPEADTLLLMGGGVGGLVTWLRWQWSKRRARK